MRRETWIWLAAGVLAVASFGAVEAANAGSPAADSCDDCHGKDGASTEADVPIIGGQSAVYLADSMALYAEKGRPCPESKYRSGDKARPATDMCRIAKELSEDEIAKLSEALAAKPFVRAKQSADASKVALGKKVHEMNCEKCHADGGSSKDDDSGILAGQHLKYMQGAFKEFDEGKREMPEKMKPKYEKLKPADKEALLQFYASFQ